MVNSPPRDETDEDFRDRIRREADEQTRKDFRDKGLSEQVIEKLVPERLPLIRRRPRA